VRCVQHVKFPNGDIPDARWNPTRLLRIEPVENIFRTLVGEVDNHILI
jgi:hypothetical protein